MAKPTSKRKRIPKKYFTCPNCLLSVYQDYTSCKFKLAQSGGQKETLVVLRNGKTFKRIPITE